MEDNAFERTIPASAEDARGLRHAFRDWLCSWPLSPGERNDWELAFSELITNACTASPAGGEVTAHARQVGRRLTLRVTNLSDGRTLPRVPQQAAGTNPTGRGLLIVKKVLDGLVFEGDGNTTVVTAWRDAAPIVAAC